MSDGMNNVDATVMKLAKDYQASKIRSNNENETRATIRENVEKLGIDPTAFQHGLRMAEDLTTGERGDYTSSLSRVLSILDGKEADLFGEEEMRKRDERKAKAAEKAAKAGRTPAELDAKTDTDPKSDPAKGGAGKKRKSKGEKSDERPAAMRSSDPVIDASLKDVHEREQAEGGEVLDGAIDGMKKSQSQIERETREKLGMN